MTGQHLYTEDQHRAELDGVTNDAWAALEAAGVKRDGCVAARPLANLPPAPPRQRQHWLDVEPLFADGVHETDHGLSYQGPIGWHWICSWSNNE
jgi:hypothetical protein